MVSVKCRPRELHRAVAEDIRRKRSGHIESLFAGNIASGKTDTETASSIGMTSAAASSASIYVMTIRHETVPGPAPAKRGRQDHAPRILAAAATTVSLAALTACTLQTAGAGGQAAPQPSSHTAPPPAPTHSATRTAKPLREPTFSDPGDRQCAITYRDNHNGTMSWTARTTVKGQLITHVSDKRGDLFRHVVTLAPGAHVFTAPVPLAQIDDAGGVLYVGNSTYGCSIAPQS